jgi:hypothetical protein
MTWVWVDAPPERIAQVLAGLGSVTLEPTLADPPPPPVEPQPSAYDVQAAVAQAFGVTVTELQSRYRTPRVSQPRQVAMYLLRELCQLRLLEIAHLFGKRDHTTVIYAVEKVAQKLRTDRQLRATVSYLSKSLLKGRGNPVETVLKAETVNTEQGDVNIINRVMNTAAGYPYIGGGWS